ncbi:MAG: hypothetical protein U0Z26_14840 [Anaerolineales bacterium]
MTDEFYKIILTSSITLCGGVLTLVAGQVLIKFLIEPFQNYVKLIAEIADSLVFYANVGGSEMQNYYLSQLATLKKEEGTDIQKEFSKERLKAIITNDINKREEAKTIFRQQASRLMGAVNMIPLYSFWAFWGIAPKRKLINNASANLIGLSNSTSNEDSKDRRIKEIAKNLRH